MHNDPKHHAPGNHRGPRFARWLIVLATFALTTAGLHALSDHYGWRQGHWGGHVYNGYGFPGNDGQGCDNTLPVTPKPAS